MRDDLDNASFGPEHFVWLWKSLLRSFRAVFSSPWAWGPALGLAAVSMLGTLLSGLAVLPGWSITWGGSGCGSRFVDALVESSACLSDLRLTGVGIVGLFLLYILFMSRVRRIMQESVPYSPGRVWRTHIILVLSAAAGAVFNGMSYMALMTPGGWAYLSRQPWLPYLHVLSFAMLPILSLFSCIYLAVLYERSTDGLLTVRGVVGRALGALWPVMIGFAIVRALGYLSMSLMQWTTGASADASFHIAAAVVLHALFFMVPVILIVEQCSLWRALMINLRFIWKYLWRYVAFVLLGCLFLCLPMWVTYEIALQTGWNLLRSVAEVVISLLCIVFITLSFRYYVREAGTRDEESAGGD